MAAANCSLCSRTRRRLEGIVRPAWRLKLLPLLVVEVPFRLPSPASVADQAIGDLQEVGQAGALLVIPVSGAPGPAKNLLNHVLDGIRPANPGKNESTNGLAVYADPLCKSLLTAEFIHRRRRLVY